MVFLQTTELLWQKLPLVFSIPAGRYCVVDGFPLPVCKFGRTRFCRSFRADGANYGKCPSQKETYYGFKVHALITLEGYITAFEITPASADDREGLGDFAENSLNLVVLGDKVILGSGCRITKEKMQISKRNRLQKAGTEGRDNRSFSVTQNYIIVERSIHVILIKELIEPVRQHNRAYCKKGD